MNPAALKVNLADLEDGAHSSLTPMLHTREFEVCKLASNPLEDGPRGYRVHKLPVTTLNMNALKGNVELSRKEIDRCKNFFALGVLYWLYDRPMENTLAWITSKFGKNPELAKANEIALKTGYNFADTTELFTPLHNQEGEDHSGQIPKITGNEATALGFVAASQLAGRPLFYGSYPITPASDICMSWRGTRVLA